MKSNMIYTRYKIWKRADYVAIQIDLYLFYLAEKGASSSPRHRSNSRGAHAMLHPKKYLTCTVTKLREVLHGIPL